MNNKLSLLVLIFVLVACTPTEEETVPMSEPTTSTTIYRNGAIYTVNRDRPWVDAVAVNGGVIVAAGTEEEAFAATSNNAVALPI